LSLDSTGTTKGWEASSVDCDEKLPGRQVIGDAMASVKKNVAHNSYKYLNILSK